MEAQKGAPAARDWGRAAAWVAFIAAAYAVVLVLARILVAARLQGPFWSAYFEVVLGSALAAAALVWPMLAKAVADPVRRQTVETAVLYVLGGALALFLVLLFSRNIDGVLFDRLADFVAKDLVRAHHPIA